MLENGGVWSGWRGQHDACWQRSHSLGMGGCQLPVVPPAVTLLGLLPSLSVSARALSATLEQLLTAETAEHVCNSIFKTTILHLMTLRLKKGDKLEKDRKSPFSLSVDKQKKWAGKSRWEFQKHFSEFCAILKVPPILRRS